MKKLFLNIIIISTAILVIMTITWFLPGTYPHDLAAVVNKIDILKNSKSPRIIFVGGSSLLTLKSPDVEKALNLPVVNLGLWGGLGIEHYLDEIRPYIHEGDIIVVTLEYGTVLDPAYMKYIYTNKESKKFRFLLSPKKHLSRYLKDGDYFAVLKTILDLCQMKTKSYFENIILLKFNKLCQRGYQSYTEQFNSNGDRIQPFSILPELDETGKKFSMPKEKNLLFLKKYHNYAAERNIRMLFYFSHIPIEEYRYNEKKISALHDMLKKELAFPIINKPRDFAFPREYFADTIYHLNEKGEALRTTILIKFLKTAL